MIVNGLPAGSQVINPVSPVYPEDAFKTSTLTPEEKAELESLKEMKQKFLDLTYGVEYEWIYFCEQDKAATMQLNFNRDNAPEFYADVDAAMEAGDEAYENFLISLYEEDVYRMYVLRLVEDHRSFNRYELLPIEDSSVQPANTYLPTWNPVKGLTGWNVDVEAENDGFLLCGQSAPTSAVVVAFMKVKENYRGQF